MITDADKSKIRETLKTLGEVSPKIRRAALNQAIDELLAEEKDEEFKKAILSLDRDERADLIYVIAKENKDYNN